MNALVSGGNRGIGLEVVKIVLNHSPKNTVFLGCRTLEDGQKVCRDMNVGDRLIPVALDICSDASILEAVSTITMRGGPPLNMLINNAGVLLEGDDDEMKQASFKTRSDKISASVAVNYHGTVSLTEALLPHMDPQSTIVSTSSGCGTRALGLVTEDGHNELLDSESLTLAQLDKAVKDIVIAVTSNCKHPYHDSIPTIGYSLSKLFLNCYTRVLAKQERCSSMHINCASPGFTGTRMCDNYRGERVPKDPALGAAVFRDAIVSTQTGVFFKESSKSGTSPENSKTKMEAWST
jgi:NAD(P)-dependent dehydrogenase (short-subunit alcohol dehydrogenase family)